MNTLITIIFLNICNIHKEIFITICCYIRFSKTSSVLLCFDRSWFRVNLCISSILSHILTQCFSVWDMIISLWKHKSWSFYERFKYLYTYIRIWKYTSGRTRIEYIYIFISFCNSKKSNWLNDYGKIYKHFHKIKTNSKSSNDDIKSCKDQFCSSRSVRKFKSKLNIDGK